MNNNTEEEKQIQSQNGNNSDNGKKNIPTVKIEVKRHQQLFDLLSDPQRMWRVLLSLFLIIVILFAGIAFVVIAIKRYYPYNVIETNLQGATTIKTEDKEVIYWLFNTADLWANSGIEVEKGDELTIRASGASYTAIHHLVDASEGNFVPIDQWVGTSGQAKNNDRDKARGRYRINKYCDEGTLLMKVISKDSVKGGNNWKNLKQDYLTNGYVEIIGKERVNLRISQPGILHFAVNDIVLTDAVLEKMYEEWTDTIFGESINTKMKNSILDAFNRIQDSTSISKFLDTFTNIKVEKNIAKKFNPCINKFQKYGELIDSLKNKKMSLNEKEYETKGLGLGYYPENKNASLSFHNCYPFINELVYYKEKQFRDAWYVDNLGSFLIVIERKK